MTQHRAGTDPRADELYFGYRTRGGDCRIMVVSPRTTAVGGQFFGWVKRGDVPHLPLRSPTGMRWGYGGSGPADTARSLLLYALDDPRCPSCGGTRKVVVTVEGERPYDPQRDADVDTDPDAGTDAAATGCGDCHDGLRPVPYQRFKWEFVTHWGEQWQMSRAAILAWLDQRAEGPDEFARAEVARHG